MVVMLGRSLWGEPQALEEELTLPLEKVSEKKFREGV
jgi:hypothetical protein